MNMIRRFAPRGKKQLLASLLDGSGLNSLLNSCSTWSGLLVLNYHRIGSPTDTPFDRNLFSATAEQLERQLILFQQHADLVGIGDLDEVFRSRRGKHILLTFDDGYRDNYEIAFPILRDCRAPATFFIATGLIDRPRVAWWDEIAWICQHAQVREVPAGKWLTTPLTLSGPYPAAAIGTAVRRYWELPADDAELFLNELAELTGSGRCPAEMADSLWMTWDMIRELHAAGQDIGGHTVDHPVLAQCSPARQQLEIETSYQRLTEMLGTPPVAFSYPVGQSHMFTSVTENLVQQAGYRWAFSFYGNYSPPGTVHPYNLPRCAVDFAQPAAIFRSRLVLPQVFARK